MQPDADIRMTKVLVLGAGGMLGHQLLLQLDHGFEIAGTTRIFNQQLAATGINLYSGVDVQDIDTVEECIDRFMPDVILNAVGIIKQLQETSNAETSIHINALFPHQLTRICAERAIRLILFSTDCVFSGEKGAPYAGNDFADARDLYGMSKYMGEVNQSGVLTLRTSIIGHELQDKHSLLEWVLSCAEGCIEGYANALFSGFTTLEMSHIVSMIINNFPDMHGIYQVSSDPISKYDLICIINEIYRLNIEVKRNMEFNCDRRLDSSLFCKQTGYQPPNWSVMIKEMLEDKLKLDEAV